jgi:hypothetical protein
VAGGELSKPWYEEQLFYEHLAQRVHCRPEQNEEETWTRIKNGFDDFHRQMDCQDLVLA